MSEHQPLPVKGYSAQSSAAVEVVNENKVLEERVLRRIDDLVGVVDGRWLAIARTHIEEGFMAMNRAVFQPKRIALPEDTTPPPLPTTSQG